MIDQKRFHRNTSSEVYYYKLKYLCTYKDPNITVFRSKKFSLDSDFPMLNELTKWMFKIFLKNFCVLAPHTPHFWPKGGQLHKNAIA